MTAKLSVLITTFNEEINLPECLASVVGWADEVFVVDSFSADRTLEIAREAGAVVQQHEYVSPAAQKNWALATLPFRNDWILILDADERVVPALRDEISGILDEDGRGCDGYYINRRYIFYGKWIRHCGWYPSWNLRLFRHRAGRYEDRTVHEHVVLDGRVGYCLHDMLHEDRRGLEAWIAKQNQFAAAEALEFQLGRGRIGTTGFTGSLFDGPVARKRWLKERIWTRVPLRPFMKFLYLYVVRLGFLDGRLGFRFCLLWAIFEYITSLHLWEREYRCRVASPAGGDTPAVRPGLEPRG